MLSAGAFIYKSLQSNPVICGRVLFKSNNFCPAGLFITAFCELIMATRLLVIDDDIELCELLTEYLGPEGFAVEAVNNGEDGAARALSNEHALVVLDVMLPGMNGFDVLRRIRAGSSIPVLMLTAKGDDIDRIVGLELGADDYLPKPFNPRELIARIRAIQRRVVPIIEAGSSAPTARDIVVNDITLSPGRRTVSRANEPVAVTAVEFLLLYELMKNAGRVVERERLAETVLGRKLAMFDRSIDVHVSSLRKKLGRERISSVRGVGYQYVVDA